MGSEIVNLINTGKLDMALLSISSEKPRLYEKGEEMFWDDEHISKGMLEAHLKKEIYSDFTGKEYTDNSESIAIIAENNG